MKFDLTAFQPPQSNLKFDPPPPHHRSFWQEPPELPNSRKSTIWVERNDFYGNADLAAGSAAKMDDETYLLIGFDTEFKTPDAPLTRELIKDGHAKSRILSYQFHAKHPDGREWHGICCPEGEDRISLQDFILFALGVGAREFGIDQLPTKIYLVGHFTRADIPAFSDFKDITKYASAIRSTFVSLDTNVDCNIPVTDGEVLVHVHLRDTILLTPQTSKSLKDLGDLVGVKKVELATDRIRFKEIIRNMDQLRSENWPLFKAYALTDAEICVRYIEQVIHQYKCITGKDKVPITLTSIGIDLLLLSWQAHGWDPHSVLGKEIVKHTYFNQKKGYYVTKKTPVDLKEVDREVSFVNECYHGGRNEQFWFGPGFDDNWSDFDLSSAYPTAMSLIGMPDWRNLYDCKDISAFTATTLGFAEVKFSFPESTRYPCLPVRTENGLIFPLTGESYCAAPEIVAALALGARLEILHGVIVPTDQSVKIFGRFIQDCLDKRIAAGKNSLQGLFWKEISNSTYGKTAQGLKEKRVYDLRDRDTKLLPPSKITNAFFAAFITSFTRALLGEIMNAIPPDRIVFSCTTDGFISNISDEEARICANGPLGRIYAEQRLELTGDSGVLEKKHAVRCPLGWRTRGQATLIAGPESPKDNKFHIVLAKGGVFIPPEFELIDEKNDEILRMFFTREPTTVIRIEAKTGIREMVDYDADFVEKVFEKRLNMEFDWKRCSSAIVFSKRYQHLTFNTKPWASVEQFNKIRSYWSDYIKNDPKCLKSLADFYDFSSFVETRSFVDTDTARYMKKKEGDVVRLRQKLCSAYKHGAAGLQPKMEGLTDESFAQLLSRLGIPCKKTDVENAKRQPFTPHGCPATDIVCYLLMDLTLHLPSLEANLLLYDGSNANPIRLAIGSECSFLSKVN
jgi:hypothetical protein